MERSSHKRLLLLSMVVVLAATTIGARLYWVQIHRSEHYRILAKSQHRYVLSVPATRGSILDRNLRELAISVERDALFAHPRRVENPRRAADLLAPIIDVQRSRFLRLLENDKSFVWLRRPLTSEQTRAVRELDLPVGDNHPIGFLPQSSRLYPLDTLAVHVLGYATIDGEGIEGVEKEFDSVLRGDDTEYLVQKDARNGRLLQLIHPPDKEPQDLVLTIDAVLQYVTERELDQAMVDTRARAASAILIDAASGQILALANRPAADPNDYGRARPEQRTNRALIHVYEPGSAFKVIPLAAALEVGTIRPGDRIFCENGSLNARGRRIRDTSPHGLLTVEQVLANSSNIGMVKITRTLEPQTLYDWVARFGFGAKTGIRLPGEVRGILRPTGEWSSLTRDSIAFGQEIGVTVVQMASSLCAIANDGVLVPPRVVLGARDSDGVVRALGTPQPRRVVSARTARTVRSMLEGVVTSGTARRAAVPGYRIGGKSGTAQKAVQAGGYSESEYVASFGGFATASDPRLVCLVVLNSPRGMEHQGGQVAAPVFSRIMTDALRHLRIAPDAAPLRAGRRVMRASTEGRVR